MLVRIAGQGAVVLLREAVVRAAPSLRWALGLTAEQLRAEIKRKGWTATIRRCPPVVKLEDK